MVTQTPSECIVETYRQVFAAEVEAITVTGTQHIIVAIAQESVFGNQAEVVGQLDGKTGLHTQLESGRRVTSFVFLGRYSDAAVDC